MASHITTDGHVVPPLNISAPAPIINLRGFHWTTVDKAINTAQRLEIHGRDAFADSAAYDHQHLVQDATHLSQRAAGGASSTERHLPAQLEVQLGIEPGKEAPKPPPFPLTKFQGAYAGNGFNTIFRPRSSASPEDHATDLPNKPIDLGGFDDDNILELNLTKEQLTFGSTIGRIPNRGLFKQPDITLTGLPYLQTVQDVTNVLTGRGDRIKPDDIHFETGMWLIVPESSVNPKTGASVVRMGSIPHGTTINAQGLAPSSVSTTISGGTKGGPTIDDIDITPFGAEEMVLSPSLLSKNKFSPRIPQDLDKFNKEGTITDEIIKNPNLVLRNAIKGQTISETISFEVSTGPRPTPPESSNSPPKPRTDVMNGGGTANISFLKGEKPLATKEVPDPPDNPNAQVPFMTSKFWIETVQYQVNVGLMTSREPVCLRPTMPKDPATGKESTAPTPEFWVTPPSKLPSFPKTITIPGTQIQYSQQVNLFFADETWPHVSVATLVPKEPQLYTMPG